MVWFLLRDKSFDGLCAGWRVVAADNVISGCAGPSLHNFCRYRTRSRRTVCTFGTIPPRGAGWRRVRGRLAARVRAQGTAPGPRPGGVKMIGPAGLRQDKAAREIAGLFQLADLGGDEVDLRVGERAEHRSISSGRSRVNQEASDTARKPPGLKSAPLVDAGKTDIVDGALGPDQVQFLLGKGQVVHGTDPAGHPVVHPVGAAVGVEAVDEVREQVDAADPRRGVRGQDHGLAAGAAADVGDPGGCREVVHEIQGLHGRGRAAGALAFQRGEICADEGNVELVDGGGRVAHGLRRNRRWKRVVSDHGLRPRLSDRVISAMAVRKESVSPGSFGSRQLEYGWQNNDAIRRNSSS